MTPMAMTQQEHDPDVHKGAIEGDRPQRSRQHGESARPGVDDKGLPDDPVASPKIAIGANEDESARVNALRT